MNNILRKTIDATVGNTIGNIGAQQFSELEDETGLNKAGATLIRGGLLKRTGDLFGFK